MAGIRDPGNFFFLSNMLHLHFLNKMVTHYIQLSTPCIFRYQTTGSTCCEPWKKINKWDDSSVRREFLDSGAGKENSNRSQISLVEDKKLQFGEVKSVRMWRYRVSKRRKLCREKIPEICTEDLQVFDTRLHLHRIKPRRARQQHPLRKE